MTQMEQLRQDVERALTSARYAQGGVQRGPGGQELAQVVNKLREALGWVREAESATPESLQAPSNLARKD